MALITISRQFGSGAMSLANMLAEATGYEVANEEIIEMLTQMANASDSGLPAIEGEEEFIETRKPLSLNPRRVIERIFDSSREYMDGQQYVMLLSKIIPQIAEKGNTIIVGRGAQFLLQDHTDAVHVLLVADINYRIKFLCDNYQLAMSEAEQAVVSQKKRRLNLMRLFGRQNIDKPRHYDLVINMARVNRRQAVDLIVHLVNSKRGPSQ